MWYKLENVRDSTTQTVAWLHIQNGATVFRLGYLLIHCSLPVQGKASSQQ